MSIKVPGPVVEFFRRFVPKDFLPKHVETALPALVTAIILGTKRTYTEQAESVFEERRDKATVSRLYNDHGFNSRDLHWQVVERIIAAVGPLDDKTVDWLMAIDGMAVQRGLHASIEGAIVRGASSKHKPKKRKGGGRGKPRVRKKRKAKGGSAKKTQAKVVRVTQKKARKKAKRVTKKKGRQTKYYMFLVGTLTTHQGVRIALPRFTCDPKDFHRKPGRPKSRRDTQLDLARTMTKKVLKLLPKQVRLVVVADSYFESEKLCSLAQEKGFVFIAPGDSNRCFADDDKPCPFGKAA